MNKITLLTAVLCLSVFTAFGQFTRLAKPEIFPVTGKLVKQGNDYYLGGGSGVYKSIDTAQPGPLPVRVYYQMMKQ